MEKVDTFPDVSQRLEEGRDVERTENHLNRWVGPDETDDQEDHGTGRYGLQFLLTGAVKGPQGELAPGVSRKVFDRGVVVQLDGATFVASFDRNLKEHRANSS